MLDIPKMIDEHKRKKIKIYPCNSNRASLLAEECERKLVYYRTSWDKQTLYDVDLQYIFDEGNLQEQAVIRELQEAGINIVEQQRAFVWKEYQITGHIDAKIGLNGKYYPLEIKSMSPNVWNSINEPQDLKKYPWTRKYIGQLVLYLLMGEAEEGILLLKNKSSGKLKQLVIKLNDYLDLGEELLKKAERINKHVKEGTLPERINDFEICSECSFKHICLPEILNEGGVEIVDNKELEEKLDRLEELKPYYQEYKKLDEEVKKMVEGKENLACGKYLISGKWVERKIPPQPERIIKFWQRKIVKIEGV